MKMLCEERTRREDISTGGNKAGKNKNRRDKNKSAWE